MLSFKWKADQTMGCPFPRLWSSFLCYVESAFSPVLILKWQTASVTIQGHGNERDEKCKDKC